jgi:cell wall assembly regulator SMI1
MSSFPWHDFLRQWSQKLLEPSRIYEQPWTYEELPEEVIASGWLGYPGASEAELRATESRLGVRLPPSYREFLSVSNGWRLFSEFIPQLWSTQQIEWLIKRQFENIVAWRDGIS